MDAGLIGAFFEMADFNLDSIRFAAALGRRTESMIWYLTRIVSLNVNYH